MKNNYKDKVIYANGKDRKNNEKENIKKVSSKRNKYKTKGV